jgi:hypothetical protein
MIIITKISLLILAAMCGLAVYRLRGSDDSPPRPIMQLTFCLPYALIALLSVSSTHGLISGVGCGIVVWIASTLAISTGHGNFQDLGTWLKPTSSETMEFIIRWAKPLLPGFWYDGLGLALIGLLVTIPCGLAVQSWCVALSGALEAPAYIIGYLLTKKQTVKWQGMAGTEIGEMLTGFFLWGALAFWVIS